MKRNIGWSLILTVLSACASGAPSGGNAKPAAGGKEETGGEGSTLLRQIKVEKVEFAPGPISKDGPYRIVLANTGKEALHFSAAPLFLSKEGYRIHGAAEWQEVLLGPGDKKVVSGSCPFTLAASIQVRVKS